MSVENGLRGGSDEDRSRTGGEVDTIGTAGAAVADWWYFGGSPRGHPGSSGTGTSTPTRAARRPGHPAVAPASPEPAASVGRCPSSCHGSPSDRPNSARNSPLHRYSTLTAARRPSGARPPGRPAGMVCCAVCLPPTALGGWTPYVGARARWRRPPRRWTGRAAGTARSRYSPRMNSRIPRRFLSVAGQSVHGFHRSIPASSKSLVLRVAQTAA